MQQKRQLRKEAIKMTRFTVTKYRLNDLLTEDIISYIWKRSVLAEVPITTFRLMLIQG